MMREHNFSPEEEREFIRLLKKIQENEYWIPTLPMWQEMQRTISRWAVEIVVTDAHGGGEPRILLSRYSGEGNPEHQGLFHIAGGFDKFPESIQATCTRIAKNELGVNVEYQGILGVHKWTAEESPFGSRLLSLYAACKPLNEIMLGEKRRFFTRKEMLALGPKDMAQNHPHRVFADQYLARMGSDDPVAPLTLGL